jgi:transposase-like protein
MPSTDLHTSLEKGEGMAGRSPYTIELSQDERKYLRAMACKYSSPYRDVIRAKIILYAEQGLTNEQIAARVDLPRQIVSKWRKRFYEQRLAGLAERPRTGRPPVFSPQSGGGGQSDSL